MKTLNCSGALLCLFLLLSPLLQAQQLKLGTAPNLIEKSALLDLNSTKQGLLLSRISDYTVAPLSTAPDGMLIYYVPDQLLYIRKNGVWRKLIDETNAITSVNGQTSSIVTLTTNNIAESVNLYYTDARARAAFSAGTGINLSGAGVISALNTTALWNASQLQGVSISATAPTTGQVLTYNGTAWTPAAATAALGGTTFTYNTNAANNNNVPIGNYSLVKITGPNAQFTITGISAGVDGQILTLYNTTNNNMILADNSNNSIAANRIWTLNGSTANTNGVGTMTLTYSTTDAKWIITAINQ